MADGTRGNEVTDAPRDGGQYARRNGAWSEVEASGGAIPGAIAFKGEWASGAIYQKSDIVKQTNGVYVNYYISLADGNTAAYNTAAKWEVEKINCQ